MRKIVLITCYFGEFPWYFGLFLKSCNYNPSVNFLIFSDSKWEGELPGNVNIIPFDLIKFNRLATEKLGFKINIQKPYKLCDFKPAYGLIFEDYIKGYSFWGMTDIDIVFGRIREFITEEILYVYDVISVRNDYPTGSFMLFRNTIKLRELFQKSRDYKKVMQSNIHYCFDECNFKHQFLQDGGDIFNIECEIESMHHVLKREEKNNNLKIHFDFLIIEGLPGQLKWDRGILSFKGEYEILMHHLILYKSNRYTSKKRWIDVPDTFYIDKYIIRKEGLSSFKGFFKNKWGNFLIPHIKKKIFLWDASLAEFFSFSVRGLEYKKYNQPEFYIEVTRSYNGQNKLSFNGMEPRLLIRSIFYKNNFYLKSFKGIRYSNNKEKGILVQKNIMGGNLNIN